MKRTTTALRELMKKDGIIVQPGVHDASSARIAELAGFKTVCMGGTGLGIHLGMGEPRLSLADLINVCRYITATVSIPLKVDAGPGFGDPVQVVHLIRELESAGVASCHIEDGVFPHRASHAIGIDPLVDEIDIIEKIKAAANAKQDPDFVIVGRSNAIAGVGFKEGIKRANLLLEAGADVAYIFPRTMEEARIVPKEVNGPCVFNNSEAGSMPHLSVREAEDLGYKFVTYPAMSIEVAGKALKESYEYIYSHGKINLTVKEGGAILNYLRDAIGTQEMCEMELRKDKIDAEKSN